MGPSSISVLLGDAVDKGQLLIESSKEKISKKQRRSKKIVRGFILTLAANRPFLLSIKI
jgi:hypothetical protein